MTQVKDVMSRGVEQVADNATIQHAAESMTEKGIGLLVVSDGQQTTGVLTDRDIVVRCLGEQKDPKTTTVQDCMTSERFTLSEDAQVEEAANLMREKQIRRVLVDDASGKVTGVVSLGDLATGSDDDQLRADVLENVSKG